MPSFTDVYDTTTAIMSETSDSAWLGLATQSQNTIYVAGGPTVTRVNQLLVRFHEPYRTPNNLIKPTLIPLSWYGVSGLDTTPVSSITYFWGEFNFSTRRLPDPSFTSRTTLLTPPPGSSIGDPYTFVTLNIGLSSHLRPSGTPPPILQSAYVDNMVMRLILAGSSGNRIRDYKILAPGNVASRARTSYRPTFGDVRITHYPRTRTSRTYYEVTWFSYPGLLMQPSEFVASESLLCTIMANASEATNSDGCIKRPG